MISSLIAAGASLIGTAMTNKRNMKTITKSDTTIHPLHKWHDLDRLV